MELPFQIGLSSMNASTFCARVLQCQPRWRPIGNLLSPSGAPLRLGPRFRHRNFTNKNLIFRTGWYVTTFWIPWYENTGRRGRRCVSQHQNMSSTKSRRSCKAYRVHTARRDCLFKISAQWSWWFWRGSQPTSKEVWCDCHWAPSFSLLMQTREH